jgi:hypothetical protein
MSNAARIAICLLLAPCLGAPGIAQSADPPAPPPAATAQTTQADQKPAKKLDFYLSEADLRRLLRSQRVVLESPDAARVASDWRAGRESIAIQKPARPELQSRPAMIECDGRGTKCAAYDVDGKYLYALPNRRVQLGINDPDTLNCGHTSDMMSSFERADRCRGIGVIIPSIWESGRRYAP